MNPAKVREVVLAMHDVSKNFSADGQSTHAVCDVSLEAKRGELVMLLGPSGSGKTTILTLLAGFLRPTSGEVRLLGNDIGTCRPDDLQRIRARSMGFVFQNFLLIDALTVTENVMIVQEFCGTAKIAARRKAGLLLQQLDVAHLGSRFPPTLSQGEKQRVAIARALANNPEIILADEPTASLESSQALEIIRILRRLAAEENRCIVAASHDGRLREHADTIVSLRDGRIQNSTPDG
ncbi:MAG TPA: ABC transporter ATP-binding protein [Bacteroidota bacterium]